MKNYTGLILEKMKDSSYSELNFEFAFKLTNESDRGAILIGASKVEEYLEKLILSILPKEQKSYTSKLLNYPGAISSFSGKIELLFAFRIIDERLYNSLNSLRIIRNKAAHSSEAFSQENFKETIKKINDFEEDFEGLITHLAYENLLVWKKATIKEILDNRNLSEKEYKEIWKKNVDDLKDNAEIKKQLITWTLSYGLTLMCVKIMAIIDEYSKFKSKTWIHYIENDIE
jgi:DNA-binding MltR family transcriptional regulator